MRGHINLLYIFPQYQSHSCIYQGYIYYKYVLFFKKINQGFFQNKLRDADTQMRVGVVYYLCILIKRQTKSLCYVHIMCYLRKIYQGNATAGTLTFTMHLTSGQRGWRVDYSCASIKGSRAQDRLKLPNTYWLYQFKGLD